MEASRIFRVFFVTVPVLSPETSFTLRGPKLCTKMQRDVRAAGSLEVETVYSSLYSPEKAKG